MKKTFFTIILIIAMLATACAPAATNPSGSPTGASSSSPESSSVPAGTSAEPAKETQLVYGSGDYTSINPAILEHGEINILLFTGLTAHDKDNKVVPSLAKDWTFDEATNTYTFNLREDVKFHDGQPFTSADVKFTIEAILNPDNASEIASNYEDIKSIETPDAKTVKITLNAPNVAMLDYLTIGILPKHLLEGKDITTDPFNQNPVGTGPYKLTSWDIGQSITLTKHDSYYMGTPKIDKIIFKIVPDSKARALQLKSGELDMAQVTPEDSKQFRDQADFAIYDMNTADYRGILYNFKSAFFSKHRELPNILSYAIDRKSIVEAVLQGSGEIAYSPLQAGPYNNPNIEKYDYNPEKAKQMLTDAGWVAGADGILEKDGEKCSFIINNGQSDQVRIDMSNIAAQQLKAIGVDATVKVNQETDWANQDAYLIGWGSPFDPDDHTYKVFGTSKGANYSGYSNTKVDELLLKARQTSVDAERKQLYSDFQIEMSKDLPYTFIAYVDAIYVAKPSLSGITKDTILGHHGVGIFYNAFEWSIK